MATPSAGRIMNDGVHYNKVFKVTWEECPPCSSTAILSKQEEITFKTQRDGMPVSGARDLFGAGLVLLSTFPCLPPPSASPHTLASVTPISGFIPESQAYTIGCYQPPPQHV